jgi:hypothetical protein
MDGYLFLLQNLIELYMYMEYYMQIKLYHLHIKNCK